MPDNILNFRSVLLSLKALEQAPSDEVITELGSAALVFIKVEGDEYHQSISGDLAKSLGHIQDSIYRLAAHLLYGQDKVSALPKEVREKLCLQFEIRAGCTESIADLRPAIKFFLYEAVKRMTPAQLFAFATICVIGLGSYMATSKEAETAQELINHQSIDKAVAELGEANRLLIEKSFALREETLRDIAKNATNATAVTFGADKFTGDSLSKLKSRTNTQPTVVRTFDGEFFVFQINSRNPELLKLQVSDGTGNDFTVLAEQDLFQEPEDLDLLWQCARTGQKVQMQITESKRPNSTVFRLESVKAIK